MQDPLEVFERVQAAVDTLRLLPRTNRHSKLTFWPDFIRSFHQAYGYNDPAPAKVRPSAKQISDLDEVIKWLSWLSTHPAWGGKYSKLIWAKAVGIPTRVYARRIRKNERTCREWFRLGLFAIVFALERDAIK